MKNNTGEDTIVILGGGLAGLAAGYELSRAKKKVIVVEKWNQVGGLARTIKVKEFSFDTGPHRWYTKSNMVNDWMLKILGKEVIKVPRLTRIYFDGKFFYYPIKLFNALSGIGPFKACQAVSDYITARIKARMFPRKLLTMEDGYINQFGKTLYDIFFKRYSEKLWGQDCKKISIDWVGQRTRGINILTIIKDTFFKSKNVVSLVDEFSYPQKGIGRLAEKLAQEIIRNGGEIITSAEVIKINSQKNKIISIVLKTDKKQLTITGEQFISSIPISDLVKMLKPSPAGKIFSLAENLHYRDELQVALFVRKTHITPDTWIYVHPKEIPFMRVMEMDNWSNVLSPPSTTTLVFEVACDENDNMWKKADNEIIKIITKSYIDEFKLINHSDVIGGYVNRMPKEYPVYHLGYKEDVDEIKQYLHRYINLQLVGRNGTFRYNNMDHSVEMGLYAAWNILNEKKLYDIESINIEREYLEEKKIENIEDSALEKND